MLNKITKGWRIFATGLSFSVFGISGLIITFFYIPIVSIVTRKKERKQRLIRSVVSSGFSSFMKFMHYAQLIDYKVVNKKLRKDDKGCLIIANHPTLIDVVAIIGLYPNSCCVVKEKLWSNPFVKHVVQGAGYIPNNDGKVMMQRCEQAIKNEEVLIIFPEGTRTTPGEDIVMQRGAAQMALALKCSIRCINIKCEPLTLYKGLKWYEVPKRRASFTVSIRDKVQVYDHVSVQDPRPIAARKLTRVFKHHIAS